MMRNQMLALCVLCSLVPTFGASVENTDLVQVALADATLVGAAHQRKAFPLAADIVSAITHKTEATPAPTPEMAGTKDPSDVLAGISAASEEADKVAAENGRGTADDLLASIATAAAAQAPAPATVVKLKAEAPAPAANVTVEPNNGSPDAALAPAPAAIVTPAPNSASADPAPAEADVYNEPEFPPLGKDITGAGGMPSDLQVPPRPPGNDADNIAHAVDDAAYQAVVDAVRENMKSLDSVQARIDSAAAGDSVQIAAQKIVAEVPILAAQQLRKSLSIGGFTSEQLKVMTPEQMRAALKELLEDRPTQELLNSMVTDATGKTLQAMDAWTQLRNQAVQDAKASSETGYVPTVLDGNWMAEQYGK